MPYEKARELASASYQHWISEELFSFNWFVMAIVILVVYIIWLKLLDKNKAGQLLLLGSLAAVGYLISVIILYGFYGFIEYKTALTPFEPPLFTLAVTIAPVTIMIVEQYTNSWKGYILWNAIGMAFIAFVLLPIYSVLGIIELHYNWNYLYQFLMLFAGSLLVRVAFLWIIGTQKR